MTYRRLPLVVALGLLFVAAPRFAAACGCFHPPVPDEFDDEFAVSQTFDQFFLRWEAELSRRTD